MSRGRRVALPLLVAVALQTAALAGLIGWKQYTLHQGTEVVLETLPVDPRSLFQGDYVQLNYAISRLPANRDLERGQTVFVELARDEPAWRFVALHEALPEQPEGAEPDPDRVYMKAEVEDEIGVDVRLHYGIEAFFVPEGEGRPLERPALGSEVTIKVAVDRFGNSAIKAILLDGEPRYQETLF